MSNGCRISEKFGEHQRSLTDMIKASNSSLVPDDLTLSLKRITSGLGRQNPVEKVLFCDSKGKCRDYSSIHLRGEMPEEKETLLVILRTDSDECRKTSVDLVRTWLNQIFHDEGLYEISLDRE